MGVIHWLSELEKRRTRGLLRRLPRPVLQRINRASLPSAGLPPLSLQLTLTRDWIADIGWRGVNDTLEGEAALAFEEHEEEAFGPRALWEPWSSPVPSSAWARAIDGLGPIDRDEVIFTVRRPRVSHFAGLPEHEATWKNNFAAWVLRRYTYGGVLLGPED